MSSPEPQCGFTTYTAGGALLCSRPHWHKGFVFPALGEQQRPTPTGLRLKPQMQRACLSYSSKPSSLGPSPSFQASGLHISPAVAAPRENFRWAFLLPLPASIVGWLWQPRLLRAKVQEALGRLRVESQLLHSHLGQSTKPCELSSSSACQR